MAIMSRSGMINNIPIAVITLAVIINQVDTTMALGCSVSALVPCFPVIQNPNLQPTPECCTNLIAQAPCYCGYLKDPRFKPYINSPGVKKLEAACAIQPPPCS